MVDTICGTGWYSFVRFETVQKGPSIKDVRKGGRGGLSKADVCGRGGGGFRVGKCGRTQNFGNFPQNSI